jgi:hypothetical protein
MHSYLIMNNYATEQNRTISFRSLGVELRFSLMVYHGGAVKQLIRQRLFISLLFKYSGGGS